MLTDDDVQNTVESPLNLTCRCCHCCTHADSESQGTRFWVHRDCPTVAAVLPGPCWGMTCCSVMGEGRRKQPSTTFADPLHLDFLVNALFTTLLVTMLTQLLLFCSLSLNKPYKVFSWQLIKVASLLSPFLVRSNLYWLFTVIATLLSSEVCWSLWSTVSTDASASFSLSVCLSLLSFSVSVATITHDCVNIRALLSFKAQGCLWCVSTVDVSASFSSVVHSTYYSWLEIHGNLWHAAFCTIIVSFLFSSPFAKMLVYLY